MSEVATTAMPSARQARAKDIRARILAAVEERADAGASFSQLSVSQLAAAAGISRATFYIYFETKAHLLQSWLTGTLGELRDASSAWLALGPETTEQDVAAALQQIVEAYVSHGALLAAAQDEAGGNAELRAQITAAVSVAASALRSQIKRGQKSGWMDPSLQAAETATWLIWMLERGVSQMVVGSAEKDRDVLVQTLASVAWRVLFLR